MQGEEHPQEPGLLQTGRREASGILELSQAPVPHAPTSPERRGASSGYKGDSSCLAYCNQVPDPSH